MVRKLAFVLLSLAVISPAVVQALGLGEIQLNSYLNQPLDARIEILSSTRGETDGMQVKLASPEAFERAGLEFTNNLRQLSFKINSGSNGKQYISVTTRKGYREPFLNFLLEVNWNSGRILREYSELVDPPSLVRAAPPATQAPRAAPVQRTQPVTPQPRQTQPKQAFSSSGSSSTPSTVSRSGVIGDTYRTQRNDTAWKIATQVRPDDSVTVEQTLMALLRTNPSAFIKQNINRLKAGYILSIPDRDSILSQSHAAAVSEMRQQTRDWRESKQAAISAPEGRVDVLSPKAEKPTDDQTTASTGSGNAAELQREVMLAKEASEAQKQENAELRLRISQLEEQITNAQKLADLKADQLAALQKNLGEISETEPASPSDPMQTAQQEAPEMPAEPVEEESAAQAEAPADEKPLAEKKVSLANVVEAKPAPLGTPVNQHVVEGFKRVDISQLPASELPAQPFKTMADATSAEQSASEGMVSQAKMYFEQNPVAKWIAIGALILVLIIIAMMIARRRGDSEDYEESILQEPVEEGKDSALQEAAATNAEVAEAVADPEPEKDEGLDVVDTNKTEVSDTSFLSDMILSDMSDMHGEGAQADPLTEADVFLAYGRFGPAENLIKGAVEKEPERNDLRLKLLEIYYSAKNKNAFLEEAKNLHEIVAAQPDPATWEKVAEMGADLCPEDSLFTYQPVASSADTPIGSSEDDTEAMDFDLSEFENQIDEMESGDNNELDLDLNALNENDSDSEDLERTVEIPVDSDAGERLRQSSDDDKDEDITREMVDDFNNIDDDITRELDIADFEGDEQGKDSDSTLLIDDELDLEDDSLDDIDEIGTKMDLARAYIDMGDPEGARSILEEVIEEGNEEQQTEARELMKKV